MLRTLIVAGSAVSLLGAPALADDRDHRDNGKQKGWYKHDRDGDRYRDDRRYNGDDRYDGRYSERYRDQRYDRRGYSWSQADARRYAEARGWPSYRYYPDRPPVATAWYPDRDYRGGANYRPRTVGWNEPVWRGSDNRYYCRRSDGTAGLIIGGLGGGVLGAAIAPGSSQTLGALIGGGLGAVLGKNLADNKVTCR